jgi:hypothetical protein
MPQKKPKPKPSTTKNCAYEAISCLIDAITISDDKERVDKARKCLDELIACEKKASRKSGSTVQRFRRELRTRSRK